MSKLISNQLRKPSGFFGHLVARIIEKNNLPEYIQMIDVLNVQDNDILLEIGYGTGAVIKMLTDINSHCIIDGIDFSKLMYRKAKYKNSKSIKQNKVNLLIGDFLLDKLSKRKYTKIFCINVVYFWKDLEVAFSKVFQLLEKDGIFFFFMASAETLTNIKSIDNTIFNMHTTQDITTALKTAKFSTVETITIETKGGLCYIFKAKKAIHVG